MEAVMFANFFAPLAIKIFSGVTAALAIALALAVWRADSLSEGKRKAEDALVASETRHAVTIASLDALEARLADMVKDGELRAETRDKALEDVEAEIAPLREQSEAFDIKTVTGL